MINFIKKYFCLDNTYLIKNLILRNLKIRYRGSIVGIFWTVLIPVLTSVVYFFVFKYVLRVGSPNYLLIIVSGLLPWTFVSQSLVAGLESIVSNQSLLNKVSITPHSLTISENITYFINLILSLPILIVLMLYSKIPFSLYTYQYLVYLILLFLFAYSLSIILSYIFVYFRDLKFMFSVVIQFWFYLTPIMYTKDLIPEKYFNLIYMNPIGPIFLGLQGAILGEQIVHTNYYISSVIWLIILIPFSICVTRKKNIVEML